MPKFPSNQRATLGFLLASLHTGASRSLWPGILDAAERHGVNLISFPGGRLNATNAYESQRNHIFDLASTDCLEGLVTWASTLGGVLSLSETSAFHQRYRGLPMVSLAQFLEGLPTVAIDSYQGMRALLGHLIKEHGFQRLAFIRGPGEHFYAQERYRAYLDSLQSYQLPLIPELVTRPLRWESGAEAIQILLDERGLKPGVDFQAVVAVSDMLAVWALKALQGRGYNVPNDVAVTGFNNSIEERLATPPLTTVDLPFYDQGGKAIEMLLAQLRGETVPALTTLPSSLVVRQSCGCPSRAIKEAAYVPGVGSGVDEWKIAKQGKRQLRRKCLAELSRIIGAKPGEHRKMTEAVIDAFLTDLERINPTDATSNQFLEVLDEALNQSMLGQQDLSQWNAIISVLRRYYLPGVEDTKRALLDALFGQARVVVSEAERRANSYWQWQAERQDEKLRETNRALLTTFDLHQISEVLYEYLPGLGIPSAYLVLFEKPGETKGYRRLVMGYTEKGRITIAPEGRRFHARQLLPAECLPQERRYSLVIEPLFFQEMSLGYAVFENGPRDGDVYELVRANLSSAIQGAMLFNEIQQARITAEKADQIKTRLLANVSHEMRTPLNIILGYTQDLLESEKTDSRVKNSIQNIQDHAEHQLRVINDLLDLSRAEIDELDLALELLDPRPLLEEAFHAIADHNTNPNVEWILNLPGRLPLIRADAVRLRQILLNLLSNARKFTEYGQVELGADVLPPYIHFWVRDTGWGIPSGQKERIFEPFVTLEQDRRISGGIGLGLSITRHLVALHGGKMSLDSEAGKGSTFHVHILLPALEKDQAKDEDAQPVLVLLSASNQPAIEIQSICERQNLQLCLVSSLDELDVVLATTHPQAVAWDLSNARSGDWNLVRRLRNHPTISQAPFILYGQIPDQKSSEPMLALGITGYIAKSPSHQSMLEAINALCPVDGKGMILIVDDDPAVRDEHLALVKQGFPDCDVRAVEDGKEALRLMEDEIPVLVLLDLIMPGLSGGIVLDRMRENPRLRKVPVIILSSKLLSLEDVKQLEHHMNVTLQSKGIWSDTETISALNRALFGSETLPAHTSALVKRAVAYLHQNYSRSISRWEIAEAIGVSEDYLSRVFSRDLEISPWDYLTRYRILQAQILLRNTEQSIGAIARAVGFNDQAYFSRVFRKRNGISPQGYREKHVDK